MTNLMRLPGARLVLHAVIVVVLYLALMWFVGGADPLTMSNIALAAMYATAMFGMVILVGLSGQVSLGNGALMAIGAYTLALTSLNWQTVPIIGVPMNGWWAMVFALIGGIVFGLIIGGLGARLKGPYLAGLTLGIAVGIPAIANRFPDLFGGETGLLLTVPFPEGGYEPAVDEGAETGTEAVTDGTTEGTTDEALPTEGEGAGETLAPDDLLTIDDLNADGTSTDAPTDVATDVPTDVSTDVPVPDVPVDTLPPSTDQADPGFLIEYWQASLAILVACLTATLTFQVVYNVGMVAGLLPVKGLPLPLMSAGRSSVLATFISIGLVLSVRMRRFAN